MWIPSGLRRKSMLDDVMETMERERKIAQTLMNKETPRKPSKSRASNRAKNKAARKSRKRNR